MLRMTYLRERCSRAGTRAILSHSRPVGQKVVERVSEYKNTGQVSNYKDVEKRGFSHHMKKMARVETVPARAPFLWISRA